MTLSPTLKFREVSEEEFEAEESKAMDASAPSASIMPDTSRPKIGEAFAGAGYLPSRYIIWYKQHVPKLVHV